MSNHVRRYREAIWKQRHRKWYILGVDAAGMPVVIGSAAEQTLARMIYKEHVRRGQL